MNIKLTPKDTFRENQSAATSHSEIMASPQFKAAASAALLQYQYRMATGEPTVAAVTAFRLKGAQEYLAELMNLGEPEPIRTYATGPGLTPPEEVNIRQVI